MDRTILVEDAPWPFPKELLQMAQQDRELLNTAYKELFEKLGMEATLEIYQMFKGQQISFPVRLLDPAKTRQRILQEYDGSNIRQLARKYDYSEKSVRRIVKQKA